MRPIIPRQPGTTSTPCCSDATATDIEELIEHVRQTVIEKHGVELVHEVRIVGEVAA